MFKKLFGNHIVPACLYCAKARTSVRPGVMLCTKKGIVDPDFSCRGFEYDPIKRIPHGRAKPMTFSQDDFSLDIGENHQ